MASSLEIPNPDLAALAAGATIVAFAPRHAVDLNDELDLVPSGRRPPEALQPRHAGLAGVSAPHGPWNALVVGLQPATSLAGEHGMTHHILAEVPDGDAVILRVSGPTGEVLSDDAFVAELGAVEAAFQ